MWGKLYLGGSTCISWGFLLTFSASSSCKKILLLNDCSQVEVINQRTNILSAFSRRSLRQVSSFFFFAYRKNKVQPVETVWETISWELRYFGKVFRHHVCSGNPTQGCSAVPATTNLLGWKGFVRTRLSEQEGSWEKNTNSQLLVAFFKKIEEVQIRTLPALSIQTTKLIDDHRDLHLSPCRTSTSCTQLPQLLSFSSSTCLPTQQPVKKHQGRREMHNKNSNHVRVTRIAIMSEKEGQDNKKQTVMNKFVIEQQTNAHISRMRQARVLIRKMSWFQSRCPDFQVRCTRCRADTRCPDTYATHRGLRNLCNRLTSLP